MINIPILVIKNNCLIEKYFNQNLLSKNTWLRAINNHTQLIIYQAIYQGRWKCFAKNTGNIHWYREKLKMRVKNEIKNILTSLFFKYFHIVPKGLILIFFEFIICWFVSDNKKSTNNISPIASPVIAQKGAFTHNGNSTAPITGQIINHIPKSDPSIHILYILSSFVFDISLNIDWIILIFPHKIPFIILPNKNTQKSWLIVIINDEIKVQIIHKRSIFFLPNLSESCHKIGQNKKEKNAYNTIAYDILWAETQKYIVKSGKVGINIQIQRISTNQTKIMASLFLSIFYEVIFNLIGL